MCRNIRTLHNFAPPATEDEIRASSLQFVRKLSGFTKPSKTNEEAFNRTIDRVTAAAHELLDSLRMRRLTLKIGLHALVVGIAGVFYLGASVQAAGGSDSAPNRQLTRTLQRDVTHKVQIQYLLFLPNGYEKNTEKWPLILYLHGGSVRGDDISQMKKLGLAEKVEADPNFPFIVVSPQCHKGEIWTDVAALSAILDDVMRSNRVDPDRVYVTGHSMGGRGALYAAYKMPDRFAAVVSLGPSAPITAWAEKLAAVPLWLFHGANDQFTPLKEVEELVNATKAAGGRPQLTVLPERDHYILDVYDRPDLYKWLAQQKRKQSVPAR